MENQKDEEVKSINERELEILKFWEENKIFQKSLETPAGKAPIGNFAFYDGPPFATGMPHHGHLLASTIKDAIPRFQTMNGYHVRRVWGWDCHGLPIENLIESKFNLNSKREIEEFGIARFNQEAEKSVFKYEEEWQKVIPRFGRWINMDHPYKTMDANYTESVWWGFQKLYKSGLISEGYKSMHICPRCETTLAQSEVAQSYQDLTDISVTAKFELVGELGTYVLAWTTTPWTLPGNVALVVNPKFTYVKVKVESGEKYILAKDRVREVFADQNLNYQVVEELTGEKLVGKKYKPLFPYYENVEMKNKENLYKIVVADFVDLEIGTGIVHIAPGFGEDDLKLSRERDLPIIQHVSMSGEFTKEIKDFVGMKVKTNTDNQSSDIEIIKYLAHHNSLFSKKKIIHAYPTCYRCGTPLLNYATSSWFIESPKLRNKMLKENDKINWVPETIKHGRFGKWLEGTRDWSISRSRYWGAPLPIWREIEGKEIKVIGSLKELAKNNLVQAKNEYYLMRHGEAVHNVEGIEESTMDPKDTLTEQGIREVEKAKKKYGHFDVIITSPYPRTLETAKIMSGDKSKDILIEKDFREIEFKDFSGKSREDIIEHYGVDYYKFNTRLDGGETNREVMNRMLKGILDLEKRYQGKKILIVSHGTPIQMALAGGELITEEDIVTDAMSSRPKYYPKTGEVKKLNLQIVPRDEMGRINLHRPYIDEVKLKSKKDKLMERIPDVLDCWVESGSMPFAQVHYPFENAHIFKSNFPAEFIAEGLDQTRGWFNSLLNLSTGIFGKTAYKNVIVNGLLLASDGEKMSKSKNNYTDPMILIERYGADALRQTLLSSPAMQGESVIFSDTQVEETYKKVVQKLENVLSFYENVEKEFIPINNLKELFTYNPLDEWVKARLYRLILSTTQSMNEYKLDLATRQFEKFIDDLSTWWLRRSRERLKGNGSIEIEKKVALLTFYKILNEFSKVIAPFMPFLAERVYQVVNKNNLEKKESVHLEKWPSNVFELNMKGIKDDYKADCILTSEKDLDKVLEEMEEVRDLVSETLKVRQKNNLPVRQPLAKLFTKMNVDKKYFEIIKEEVNVKEVIIDQTKNYEDGARVMLDLELTKELLREGQYRELVRKIKDLRKEGNFSSEEILNLEILGNEEYLEFLKSVLDNLKKDTNLGGIDLRVGEEQFTLSK